MSPTRSNAFSLLELVLVLVIIGIALAVVTPSLGGWSRGMRFRSAGDELLAATRLARDRAVTAAAPHALVALDGGAGWSVERADAPEAPHLHAGLQIDAFVLPPGWSFRIESPAGEPLERLTFYPDSRGDAGVLQLMSERGEAVAFERESTASGFLRRSEVRP